MNYITNEILDEKWLKTTITIMDDYLKDLIMWSIYNGDKLNIEIGNLISEFKELKKASGVDYIHEKTVDVGDGDNNKTYCIECDTIL